MPLLVSTEPLDNSAPFLYQVGLRLLSHSQFHDTQEIPAQEEDTCREQAKSRLCVL